MKFKALWVLILFCLIALSAVPLLNLFTLGWNSLEIDWKASATLQDLALFGDFFGGHTAAVSGLLSVALILYFSLRQAELQDRHFKEQLKISSKSAELASISNIYRHYDEAYGEDKDIGEVLENIAAGHRRWAIRESFSVIDPDHALEPMREKQVANDYERLMQLLRDESTVLTNCSSIADLTSSLLLEKRLPLSARQALWPLYEVLRENPLELLRDDSSLNKRFYLARSAALREP